MTVHFVGAGPGAADLLTVRATRLLAEARVVLFPGTYLDPDVLAHCGPDARLVDTQDLDLDRITEHLVDAVRADLPVVRLTSGDPSLYSALHEQTRRLDAAGVPRVAQSVVLTRTRARSTPMGEGERLADFAATGATLVLHLAITRTRDLMAELAPVLGEDCPVVVVHRASQPGEQVLRGTVGGIADAVEAAGLRQAAVILVGPALAGDGGESYLYSADRERRS